MNADQALKTLIEGNSRYVSAATQRVCFEGPVKQHQVDIRAGTFCDHIGLF